MEIISVTRGAANGSTLAVVGALLVLGTGCASKDADVRGTPAPTLLAVHLPADVQVWVDDVELGVTPLPEKQVASGEHTVRVKTACGEVTRAGFEVLAERTTPLTAADLPGFATAELRVTAKTHLGEPVPELAVFVDEQQLATPAAGAPWAVPACRLRVRVAAVGRDDLGGVIEDIEFGADSAIERAVVLAPGPDMVRIPAGSFVFGPNDAGKKWLDEMMGVEGFAAGGPPWDEQDPRLGAKVEMPTFEIDKSEVTVAQYLACRSAAKRSRCYDDADCHEVGGCSRNPVMVPSSTSPLGPDGGRTHPSDPRACFVGPNSSVLGPGDADKPMNCLVPWEAEKYCKWAGKRLATDVEWEYVARSRRTEHSQPWGEVPDVDCMRSACTDTTPRHVCSIPAGDTVDGVCDMMGNVAEIVVAQKVAGVGMPKLLPPAPRGSSVYSGTNFVYETNRQAPFSIGFRCARDIASLLNPED